ncbi:hypothetical protein SAMN05428949_3887 [Chitinophaga sp. YR627]|uniref:hypothetical protein n=1 Tax=Chitinophaga sp. YR627 TaxID=1881041 RepID=UPI0008E4A4BE|nr:hypothetical protein [Chitinophaga sp. YR627]SFN93036.1 hypothetical protein SAMN05428949_3887 [Chitinophaga sp. YR627]
MKAQLLEKKLGLQQVSKNDNALVLQRNVAKHSSKKRGKNINLQQQPKLTLHLFDQQDIENLRELEVEISKKFIARGSKFFSPLLHAISDFLVK